MFYYKDQTRNYDPEAYEKHPILSYTTPVILFCGLQHKHMQALL